MSVKFVIKNTADKAVKEGDTVIRYSGVSEPFFRSSERGCVVTQTNEKGQATGWSFVTGLDEDQVEFYNWYNEEEKNVLRESIKSLAPTIEKYYNGKERIKPSNYSFWKKDRGVSMLSLTNETIDVFFDTSKPTHALLYLSIAAGAFSDLVAPTREWAERFQIPHYMALEVEANDMSEDTEIRKSDAHALLADIRKNHGRDALFILGWVLQYDTTSFGAYHRNTSERELILKHIAFIDGQLKFRGTNKKKDFPKLFIEAAQKWESPQTRQLLYTEAYIKAGEYFNYINSKDKRYTTVDGTSLGNTLDEAIKTIMKPKYTPEYEKLREQVENKWKD